MQGYQGETRNELSWVEVHPQQGNDGHPVDDDDLVGGMWGQPRDRPKKGRQS